MKIRKKNRFLAILLVLVMVTVSFSSFHVQNAYGVEQAQIGDVIELRLNDGTVLRMNPYPNACYETSFTTVEGLNRYEVLKNGNILEEAVVDVYPGAQVYVRYFPYRKNQVVDSVNDSSQFKMDGAWVGELTKLNFVRSQAEQFKDWYPEEENGLLNYVGGGMYQKSFYFTEPLPNDVTLEYKVAFGKGWETPTIGGPNNANLKMTIPAGTQSVFVWADSVGNKCVTSVETGTFQAAVQDGSLEAKPEGTVAISLIGDFNGNQDADGAWVLDSVGKRLYGKNFWLSKGQHTVTCLFDGQFVKSGDAKRVSPAHDGYVYFLYDSERGELYDSVNNASKIEALLNYERPLTVEELDKRAYSGNDLGAVYSPSETQFKVWAPTASAVSVNLYDAGAAGEGNCIKTQAMTGSKENGVWTTVIPGDLNGIFYTYSVTVDSETKETVDLYAKAVGVNGNRGMIINLADANPDGWESDTYVQYQNSTDAIIWETHVRDFSVNADSGISEANRGKYLAFTETGTTVNGKGKISTGIDYLKEIGVNYVHLLPTQDFVNDETAPVYNWGYSTKNYCVPEGSYSTNPADGYCRIREFKQMVQSLHKANIGVVMDVVYNHTGETETSWFNLTVPKYYYRLDENGEFLDRTLCGNETASERAMFRKYMIDSLLYWAKEYHVDGFRFDLMAIHDTETMNAIRKVLDDAGLSNVILYGEPWYATDNDSELAPGYLASNKNNAYALNDRIAMFNSYTRTGIIGGLDGSATGFVQGDVPAATLPAAEGDKMSLMSAVTGSSDKNRDTQASPAWARNPSQSLSYTSCHDDCTLYDWLYNSIYGTPENTNYYGRRDETLVKLNKLAALINMSNQGSVLFQAGEEFARTKKGDSDSYQSSDSINALQWSRLEQFSDIKEYYKGLISIRKQIAAFRDPSTTALSSIQMAAGEQEHVLAYTIQNGQKGTDWATVAVLANAACVTETVELPEGTGRWAVLADENGAGTTARGIISGNTITVPAQSGMILVSLAAEDTAKSNETIEGQTAESQDNESGNGKSKQKIQNKTRYLDENGKVLTGWILYDRSSKTAEPFDGTIDDGDIYYCDSDGYQVSGWQKLWAPEYEDTVGPNIESVLDDDAQMNWYYFKENGKVCRSEKHRIEGEYYCFDSQGRRLHGWIYETLQEGEPYVKVDSDTPKETLDEYNKDYSKYLYANPYDGKISRNKWEYLIYPGREEELSLEDDGRSFYFAKDGHLEAAQEAAVKSGITVDELGTYRLRDYSQPMSIVKIDGEWYLLDNLKGSIGDVIYLTGGSEQIPDGFYCFKGENNKMITGEVMLREDDSENSYYYYFAAETGKYRRGQGVTGVFKDKLYYQGLAVGAQEDEKYEVVYLPTIAEEHEGATGMFLVDEQGDVRTGSYLTASDGRHYKVKEKDKNSKKYGYLIYEVTKEDSGKKTERLLTENEASRIYLDDIER